MSRLRTLQPWKDLAHGLLLLPVAITTFSVAVTWVVGAIGGLTFVAWRRTLPADAKVLSDFVELPFGEVWSNLMLGALLAVSAPVVLSACVRLHHALAKALLSDDLDP